MVTMLISSAKECEDQAPSYLGFSIDVMPKDVSSSSVYTGTLACTQVHRYTCVRFRAVSIDIYECV